MKLFVRVFAGARVERIEALDATHLRVHVRARALEGRANEAVRRALATHLRVAPSRVVLVRGVGSRDKVYLVGE